MTKTNVEFFYVVVSTEEGDSIVSYFDPGLGFTPLVAGDEKLVSALTARARVIAKQIGKRMEVRKYAISEVLQVIDPRN